MSIQIPTKKMYFGRSKVAMPIVFVAAVFLKGSPMTALAQEQSQQKFWKNVRIADARVQNSHTIWERVLSIKPNPHIDVDKIAALAVGKARQEGKSDNSIREDEQLARRFAEQDKHGVEIKTTLVFTRVEDTTRCDIFNPGVEATNVSHSVDFFDGKNAVYSELKVKGNEALKIATLTRDQREVLAHSASGWMLPHILTGLDLSKPLPFSPGFSPLNSTLRMGPEDTLILERKTDSDGESIKGDLSMLHRLTLSDKYYQPLYYERVNLLYDSEKEGLRGRVSVLDYKLFKGGIRFPSKVVVDSPAFTMTYNLVKAEFNEVVDPMKARLPAGVQLRDIRFGESKGITYIPKNGQIPTDDEVRKMLGLREEKVVAEKTAETESEEPKRTASLSFAPGMGLLFLSLGMMLWSRSKKS